MRRRDVKHAHWSSSRNPLALFVVAGSQLFLLHSAPKIGASVFGDLVMNNRGLQPAPRAGSFFFAFVTSLPGAAREREMPSECVPQFNHR